MPQKIVELSRISDKVIQIGEERSHFWIFLDDCPMTVPWRDAAPSGGHWEQPGGGTGIAGESRGLLLDIWRAWVAWAEDIFRHLYIDRLIDLEIEMDFFSIWVSRCLGI